MEDITTNFNNEDLAMKAQMEKMIGTYDKYMKYITLGREKKLREETVNLAQIQEGEHILEIGCATGTLTMTAKYRVGNRGKVCAIDIIPGMIELSREKANQAGLDIDFQLGSIDNIPYSNEQFDAVICSFMIFHMSEKVRNKGFEEIYRVLKPGGRLLILDIALPEKSFSRKIMKVLLGFMIKHELNELDPRLEFTGFRGTKIAQANFRVFGLPLLSYLYSNK